MKRRVLALIISLAVLITVFTASYTAWNRLDPVYTCARCHEVFPSHERWTTSAHRGIRCTECHGTALSDGFRSVKEKTGMILSHFTGNKYNDDIKLTEAQVLALADKCASCHRAEHAGWLAGGHAVDYREIFSDPDHNKVEKPYPDCFRCHGMFYDGSIHDLMQLEGGPEEWRIREGRQSSRPAIPCLTCHQVHAPGDNSEHYVNTMDHKDREPNVLNAFYIRAEKMHLRADMLTPVVMLDRGGRPVETATDPATMLCLQCHSPDYRHTIGSQDDRTVTGAHRGLSCIACHRPHSGQTRHSCALCHSDLTDEQVRAVYADPHSFQ